MPEALRATASRSRCDATIAFIIKRRSWVLSAALFSAAASLSASCDSSSEATSAGPASSGAGGASSTGSGEGGTGGRGGAGGEGGAGGAKAWVMGEPFSAAQPAFAETMHPLAPTPLWGGLMKPYPTNAAWMDLVLGSGVNPVNVLPYVVKTLDNGLLVSMPKKVVQPKSILSVFNHDISFETIEQLSSHEVTGYDALSVTMRWSGAAGGSMTAPLVRGMPYATVVYDALAPRIESAHAITSVNDGAPSPVTADRFTVALNNGQTWVVYASEEITFNWSASGMSTSAPFTGYLRAAVLDGAPGTSDALDAHRAAYPTGGDVAASVAGDEATVEFKWKKEGTGPLMMAALPHHNDVLVAPSKVDVSFPTLRGAMTGIAGDSWTMAEPLSPIAWSAPAGIDPEKAADIMAALAVDAAEIPTAKDPYAFGKQIAKLGRLALIADELGDAATATSIREQMKAFLDPWLDGTNEDPLLYESTWGGIVSKDGLANSGADFGQGYYNDHHFHYGYHIYAAAALAKGDPAWLAAKKAAVVDLIRDIANPSSSDPFFTPFRNKDWFEGHSWAAGLFPFGDGRNQESTSEAVNAWYGVYLFGLAAGDENITNVGRVLLGTEIRASQRYWQIKDGDGIYDDPFAQNKVVGVLWGTKVDYATFFGGNPEFIHGIQMIPFTPISEALLPKAWVTEQYPVVEPALAGPIEEGWKGLLFMEHAIIDPAAAWAEAATLTGYDDGNTKTNTLYWIATRPK